jgi:hypothetical protein
VRGASALGDLLDEFPGASLEVVVVWEPVLPTDVGPPLTSVLAGIDDRRASQFWDPERALSADIVRAVDADPRRYGFDEPLGSEFVVWDVVAVFGPDARWDEDLPVPVFYDGPVVNAIDGLRSHLVALENDSLQGACTCCGSTPSAGSRRPGEARGRPA